MNESIPEGFIHSQILLHIAVTWGTLKANLMPKSYPVSVKLDHLEVEAKQFLKAPQAIQCAGKLGENRCLVRVGE